MFSTLSPVPRIENVNIVRALVKRVQFELFNSQNLHKYVNIQESSSLPNLYAPLERTDQKQYNIQI